MTRGNFKPFNHPKSDDTTDSALLLKTVRLFTSCYRFHHAESFNLQTQAAVLRAVWWPWDRFRCYYSSGPGKSHKEEVG